jgi:ribosomal protein S18 acetylase RimI-like enzyme
MKIRPFEEPDRAQVVSLWERCGLIVQWNDPNADIDRKKQVQPELFLVGEEGGSVVATAMGGYDGHRGWVFYLAVDPGRRRQGLGREIMERLEDLLRERGCPKINLEVRRSNLDVVRFYERIGYLDNDVVGLGKRLVDDRPSSGDAD